MAIATSNLVGFYTMGELSGSEIPNVQGGDGIYASSISFVLDAVFGKATHYTASSELHVSLEGTDTSNITVALSFRTTSGGVLWTQRAIRESDESHSRGIFVVAGKIQLFSRDGDNAYILDEYGSNYNDGEWHRVVFRQNGPLVAGWIDGVFLGEEDRLTGPMPMTKYHRFGRYTDNEVVSVYSGDLDWIRIYNAALSGAECLALSAEEPRIVAGYVEVNDEPEIMDIALFDATTMELVGSGVAATDGTYEIPSTALGSVYVAAIPPAGYRPKMHGPVFPVEDE